MNIRGQSPLAILVALALSLFSQAVEAADPGTRPQWEGLVAAAKKEGRIVLAIPPARDLRSELEKVLRQKFGLEAELVPASGPKNASRIAAEQRAGVQFFDALICGTGTAARLTHDGMLEPMDAFWVLPEVKDPKQWWGGHIWEDNVSTHKFLYSFLADVSTHGIWYNGAMVKPNELRSFDDYLAPKWKGKIGFSDPRVPSSGQSIWSFMWELKGEQFLKKLVQQDLFITRDLRQLGDALAKGNVAIAFGLGRSQAEPFVQAGLPLHPVPPPKEGLPASNSFGVVGIVKNPPHPNAARVFINWFLGREGQEWYGKIMENGSRRLDVDTTWLKKLGVTAAKDSLAVADYHRLRNHLEDKYTKVRVPAGKFADAILK